MITEKQINDAVSRIFDEIRFTQEPRGLYDPLRYMISIGGKRIRPRLCLTSYSLFRDSLGDDVLPAAAALEVFHTFTLIHDDIMDRSPLRRGMPTVWTKWNGDTAILSGDVMLIDAYRRMASVPPDVRDRVLELFSDTAALVCEGQQLDMDFENRPVVGMPDYEKMIGLKTAVLLACSAEIGAMVAGAPDDSCREMYSYGYELGMAFQVADDYLDAYGDEKVFGKPIGGDIINGKKSWLTVRALEKTDDPGSFLEKFNAIAGDADSKAAKINGIKAEYDTLGVASDALAEIERYSARAMEAVRNIGTGSVRTEMLSRFAESLIGRVR